MYVYSFVIQCNSLISRVILLFSPNIYVFIVWTYNIYCLLTLHYYYNTPGVVTSTSATVCNCRTTTLECDIAQSSGVNPAWRVFTTSDTSKSHVATRASGENTSPYNYPTVQPGDTVPRLEVMASSNIDGYHFQCRLDLVTLVDSPGTGTITVTGMNVMVGINHVHTIGLGIGYKFQIDYQCIETHID